MRAEIGAGWQRRAFTIDMEGTFFYYSTNNINGLNLPHLWTDFSSKPNSGILIFLRQVIKGQKHKGNTIVKISFFVFGVNIAAEA